MIRKIISAYISKTDDGVFDLWGVELSRENVDDDWVKGNVKIKTLNSDYDSSVDYSEKYAKKNRLFLSKSYINYKENKIPIKLNVKSKSQKFAKSIGYNRDLFELAIKFGEKFIFSENSDGVDVVNIYGYVINRDEFDRFKKIRASGDYVKDSLVGKVGEQLNSLLKLNSISNVIKPKEKGSSGDMFNSGYRILKFTNPDGSLLSFTVGVNTKINLTVGDWYSVSFTISRIFKGFGGVPTTFAKVKHKTTFNPAKVLE